MNFSKTLYLLHFLLLQFAIYPSQAQKQNGLVSGPRADFIQLRNATIWLEVAPSVKKVAIKYYDSATLNDPEIVTYKGELGKEFNPIKIELNGLKMNTNYSYAVILDNKAVTLPYDLKFKTRDLWQWRKPAPDFNFLTGSCAYFNEPIYDRPGKPYGSDSSIFETMAETKAAFNVWLGDNWYTRESDYFTQWGMAYRAHHDMSLPVLQKFMSSMPQYAIWDDHDYGPDDEGKSFILKDESRKIFMNYWCNPSFGEDGKGIYTQVSYSDVDLFLTDDRYFRSEDGTRDSINGKPNRDKSFFGRQQLDWLENALVYSRSTFRVIAVGSQVLNPYVPEKVEGMNHYSAELNELLDFIKRQKITGVLFISGDRHHSEVNKMQREGAYTLYDITISPFTAGISKAEGIERNSAFRVPGTLVEEQNFANISVSGKKNDRTVKVEFIGLKGKKLAEWMINEQQLK